MKPEDYITNSQIEDRADELFQDAVHNEGLLASYRNGSMHTVAFHSRLEFLRAKATMGALGSLIQGIESADDDDKENIL